MNIYTLVPDSDKYDSLQFSDPADYAEFHRFLEKPLASSWEPVPVYLYKAEQSGDFPSLLSHVPVFSERALTALLPLIGDSIEALPLACQSHRFYSIHVLDLIECLDTTHSSYELDPDGEVMYIDKHVFDEQQIKGKTIFKWRQAPLYEVYVSEEFKKAVEKERLPGLIFKSVG